MSLCSSFHTKLKVLSKNTRETQAFTAGHILVFILPSPLLGKGFVSCASPRSKADTVNSRWMMMQEDLRVHITMITPVDQRMLFFFASLSLAESLHTAKSK